MALDRELRRLLEYARLPEAENSLKNENSRPTALYILQRLKAIQQQTTVPSMSVSTGMNVPELLVLTAESALFQGDFDTAAKSIEWFFSECQLKNQFYCRAQFVRAHCGSNDAQADTGVMKLKKVLNAIHFILAVLPIATDTKKRPTYDFLVYNASVTYWQIARQLMKQSTYQFLAPSLIKIVDALKLTAETDVAWLLRLQIALVYAQVDANQLANAAKTINDVVDVQITPRLGAADESFKALYEEALRIQVHVGSFKDAECQKIVPNVKRLLQPNNKRASMLVKLQCVKSGNLSGTLEAAYVEIVQEATGFVSFTGETSLEEVKNFVESLEPRALEAIDAEIVVEIAIHAAFNGVLSVAAACDAFLQRKGKNMSPKTRVLCQVLSAVLLVVTPATHTGVKSTWRQRQAMVLSSRVEAIKTFERALIASKRQQDPQLIERVCVYVWNLSLPLLQPHLRSHLSRVFTLSSSILEELDSLLLGFRARLYLEVAKVEVVSDFLVKAHANVSKALSLDYGVITRNDSTAMTIELLSTHKDWITRPVDTHLLPIKQRLDLKLAAEDSPSKLIEVMAMLEQVKDQKDPQQQRNTLTRCIETMADMSSSDSLEDQVRLWSEISSLAWHELHDGILAQQAVESALSLFFSTSEAGDVKILSGDKSVMILEIDMRLLMVEILAAKLKDQAVQVENVRHQAESSGKREAQGRKSSMKSNVDLDALMLLGKETYVLGIHRPEVEESSTPITGEEDAEPDETSVQARQNALCKEIQAMKGEILEQLARALKAATKIGWTFVLENTCIYLWNYHFHIFRMLLETDSSVGFDPQWILPECVSTFETLYAALEAVATEVDTDLLANIGLGLSSVYKKTCRLDKALAIADTFLKRKPISDTKGSTMSVLHLKRFAELKSQVQIAQNAKDITPTDSTSAQVKVIAYLEAMEVTFNQQPEKAQGFYQKAITMWQTSAPEIYNSFLGEDFDRLLEEEQQLMELYVEIWVRVGCGAFRLKNIKYAIECAEQALLPLQSAGSKKALAQELIVGSTWKWFALAELLYGHAVFHLDQGDSPAQKLLLASLSHLVRAVEYGLRGNASTVVIRAGKVVWNATVAAINSKTTGDEGEAQEENFYQRVVRDLKKTLHYLDQVIASSDANLHFYGEMVLLTLAVCEKANNWSDQFEICESVLKAFGPTSHRASLPSEVMKEIQTAAAISGAYLGKPSSMPKSGGSSKSPEQLEESLVRAQILKKVAFSSWKDPSAQLKALSSAHIELEGQPEEQALVLVDIAEWFFTNQFSSQNADTYLECALSSLLSCQKVFSEVATSLSRKASTGQLSVASRQKLTVIYSPLWFAEKQFRIFMMRAKLAKTCKDRSKHVRLALYEVEKAWEHILVMKNEAEYQATYERENPDAANRIDFDEWKKDKAPTYVKPTSESDWINFFMKYEENATNRFYVSWGKLLQSVQTSTISHFSQPVLTLTYLEDLLSMLRDELQYSVMIPSFYLFNVLFHAYIPQRTYIAQIWMELTQFDLMERLNMSNFALPLQNALDMIQTHGDKLIKELQEAHTSDIPEGGLVSKKRHIFHSSQLDSRQKLASSIKLLLQFGFVRQAKTLLEILRYSADISSSSITSAVCEILSSRVLEMEGQTKLAFARVKSALDTPQLDITRFLEWTLRYCKLNPDPDQALSILKVAEKQAAKTVVAAMRRPVAQTFGISFKDTSGSSHINIGIVQLMAWTSFKQATILLKKASTAQSCSILSHLQESKRALEKSLQMISLVDAHYLHSQLLIKYSAVLQSFQDHCGSYFATAELEARGMLQTALTLQEKCLANYSWFLYTAQTGKPKQEGIVTPLEVEIALTKLEVARLVMTPELSSRAVKEKEMTWYRYYEDSQRSVVDKWLNTTDQALENTNSFELPRAMTLITSAISSLTDNPTLEIQHAIAQVLRLQCQRLELFHGDDKQKAEMLRTHLWTRYTSSDARHATWVCCHGARAELAFAAADAQSQKEKENQKEKEIPVPPPEDEEEEEEGVDEVQLEEMLTAHAANVQKYQLIAFEKQCAELLRLCSNELIQVLGCRHPFDCAKNVLKNQSGEVIEEATSLFSRCVAKSNVQQLHLRRMEKLQATHTSASTHSLPFQLSQLYLNQQSESFKRMSVGFRVDSIVAALPSSIRVMCLHFSPDHCFLYAALLGSTERRVAISRMEFTETQSELLAQLQKRIQTWRVKCAKETLAYEERHKQDEMCEFMSTETLNQDEDPLEDEFTSIINDTVELLNPLFTHSAMKAELKSNLSGNTLILLLDRVLDCLPMEALPVLQPADAIARDFSIQMLHQRLMAMKKQPLRPNEIRVIVDPYNEDPGNPSGQTMTSVVKQGGGGWKDALEHGQIPSVTDWQQALLARRGGGLMYVGPNRVVGSCLPLQQVTGMNVALTCQAMILLDHAENSKSVRRQSKLDSEKPAWEKEVECDSYARALLLTLCGVNVLVINQWATTFNSNRRLASGLLQNMSKGYYVGKALKKCGETTIAESPSTATLPAALPDSVTAAGTGSDLVARSKLQLKNRFRHNAVVYGLAHLVLKSND